MSNPTQPLVVPIVAGQKMLATTTFGPFDLGLNNAGLIQLDATAQGGSSPTLDVVIQDGPTPTGPWSTLFTFTQITAATGNQVGVPTRAPNRFIQAVATLGGTATPYYTFSLYGTFYQTNAIRITFASSALAITGTGATAFAVGPNGTTNPTFLVDPSTSSAATGLKIKSAAAAAGLAVSVISSGTNENLTIDAKGSGTISPNVTGTGNIVLGRAATGVSLTVTGGILSSGPTGAGIGYATGAGGTVTQASNRTTGVTLSKLTGQITTNNASLAAAAFADFVVTNTTVAATDVIVLGIIPGGTGSPRCTVVNVAAGSFTIRVTNDHASTADTSADVINFCVLKGVSS